MKIDIINPKKSLNKAFLKVKPIRDEIETFKTNLIELLDRTNDTESEEFHKNLVADFLKKTYYEPDFYINTKGRQDLVIHNGNKAKDPVGVILETKKPTNKNEMVSESRLNVKAFQELVLYYLRERITEKNLEVKYLIITNINEWYIFNANDFEKHFAQNKAFVKQFQDFENGSLSGTKTDFFYKEIAAPAIDNITANIECTYFDIRKYEKALRNEDLKDDKKLIALFKLLSPQHVLKRPFTNDSNSLDKGFYAELLHIIGLSEEKQGSKKVIQRNDAGKRNNGSLLEDAILQLDSLDKISRLDKPGQFGTNTAERLFNVGLELSITWVNRVLFLKLLEAQLQTYHDEDKKYAFLNSERIRNYDDLNTLFFQVLARKYDERNEFVQKEFEHVPYLNSSLFEPTDLEHDCFSVTQLNNNAEIPLYSSTVLKNNQGKTRTGKMNTLEYLFAFLNAYDFGGEGSEDIQEDNKTLINASVLGLIFEKINGYKDGSFFTPGFITMYMCRETIRKAVMEKFNEKATAHTSAPLSGRLADHKGTDSLSGDLAEKDEGTESLSRRIEDKEQGTDSLSEELIDTNPEQLINTNTERSRSARINQSPFSNLTDIYNAIGSRGNFSHQQANELINDVKICDPAVGSGHFLVSALNEMIAVKHELGVLHDRQGKLLRDYDIHVENDELIVTDYNGELFEYNPNNKESQRVQETLFHEKQTIIENCLFGVDINQNSVKICRLRLWIELLKNAYYESNEGEAEVSPFGGGPRGRTLQTLPNIDINIKCGNSLISRFDLDADLSKALRKSKWNMDGYRLAVKTYRQAANKEQKREMERLIADIKGDFETEIETPFKGKLSKARGKVNKLTTEINTKKQWGESVSKKIYAELKKTTKKLKKLEKERDDIQTNKIYENAFEWRFEFPEVLDDDGNYVGFDVVIGNPPYIRLQGISSFANYYNSKFISATKKYDIYVLFVEKSFELLNKNGFCNFILPHKFLVSNFGVGLREYLIKNNALDKLIHFGSHIVFEDASTYTCLFTISKRENNNLKYVEIKPSEISKPIKYNKIDINLLNKQSWNLKDEKILKTLNSLDTGNYLKDISKGIYQGLISNGDSIFILKGYISNGIFKGFSQYLNSEVELEEKIMKPILKGKNIQRYMPLKSDIYIIYPHKQNEIGKTVALSLNELKNEFPLAYKYLNNFKDELTAKKIKYKTNSIEWYSLHRSREIDIFENDYLISPQLQNTPSFTINNDIFYADAGGYMINGIKNIKPKTLLGILNSKVMWFFIKNTSSEYSGGYFYFKTAYLEPFPIPNKIDKEEKQKIESLVDQILTAKESNPKADTSILEAEIDQLVYALYGLTEEEIAIVENS